MIAYVVLLAVVTVLAYFGRVSGNSALRAASLLAIGALLVLFAGLRSSEIGTDTGRYVAQFYSGMSFSAIFERHDFGYFMLSWFARFISDSYAILLLLIAMIVVSCYMRTIIRVVERYESGLYLLIVLGVYTFFFNGARQGIASAICFMAIPFLLERRVWPYLALVVLAAFFHRTALIALPLFWVASPQVRLRRLVALGVATVLLLVFLRVFVDLAASVLSERYAYYADIGDGGGELWVAFLVGQGFLLYYFKSVIPSSNTWYARLLNIYLIGLVPALASTISGVDPSGVLRLHFYFSSTAILLWPMVFRQFGGTPFRGILSVGFLAVTLGFFVLTTSAFSDLTPYRFNWEALSQ